MNHTLAISTKSGSYWHAVTFTPISDTEVKVTSLMRDTMCGNYSPYPKVEVKPISAAREEYRKLKRFGYRAD
jgi:hypothetical protein